MLRFSQPAVGPPIRAFDLTKIRFSFSRENEKTDAANLLRITVIKFPYYHQGAIGTYEYNEKKEISAGSNVVSKHLRCQRKT